LQNNLNSRAPANRSMIEGSSVQFSGLHRR